MLLPLAIQKFSENQTAIERSQETIKGYMQELKSFNKYMQNKQNSPVYITDITTEDIEDYLYFLKEKSKAAATRARSVYIMRAFFKYLANNKMIPENPSLLVNKVKVKEKERTHLTELEVKQLINAITIPTMKTIIHFLYHTGLRISEATNLKLDHVNLPDKLVHVLSGKGDKDRKVPLNNKAAKVLSSYLKNDRPDVDSDNFFALKKTGRVSNQYINRTIKDATKSLNWKKEVTAHNLRHSYATALLEQNVNIIHISKLLGHSSVKVTSVYTHSNIDELRKAVENL